jgi:serine/threonine-protein kinase HipA
MQMANDRTIYVYADWEKLPDKPALMGVLTSVRSRGKEIFSFEYNTPEWLAKGYSHQLDPDLQFYGGRQYSADAKPNFGLFLDSSPDRWGRVLMKRRESILARKEERKPATLLESDFLLGVYDEHRIGALRFKLDPAGEFVNSEKALAAPPWTSIRELEQASLQLEQDDYDDDDALKWLNMLMAPGSSLGGARPKASVKDEKGQLWIAKFPSGADEVDIGAWEAVALEIAARSGVKVGPYMARKFSSKHHSFLSRRFDRTSEGGRIHFASAMTLLGHSDGADYSAGVSYLDLVSFITQYSARVREDLEELWRRIVLNICISNTDDHLRNHGFLLTDQGWTLSPVYDVNPIAGGTGLKLNISEDDNSLDLELARSVRSHFRISATESEAVINRVQKAVNAWRKIAGSKGISKREQDLMEGAFLYN